MGRMKNSIIEIDVYFHVFTSGSSGSLSDETITKQMDVLNRAFSGDAAHYNECNGFTYGSLQASPFRFNLKTVERINNSQAYNVDSNSSRNLRRSLRGGTCKDLYIYTGTTSLLGWATFPSSCSSNLLDDGVVMNYGSLPDEHISPYNEGDTLVHEVGHWLGLLHTFQGGCGGSGDSIADTAAESSAAFNCPIGRDSCNGGGDDPIHNFMDYTDDCCMYRFTEDQVERMIGQANVYRELTASTNSPTDSPTNSPINSPTESPTDSPTESPTDSPTDIPTDQPSSSPSESIYPTGYATENPSNSITNFPSNIPTNYPTLFSSMSPSFYPSLLPSLIPSQSSIPSSFPSLKPTPIPSNIPSFKPTIEPSTSSPTIPEAPTTFLLVLELLTNILTLFNTILLLFIPGRENLVE